MPSEGGEGAEFTGGREASAEEREFHSQQANGNRADNHEHDAPRESSSAERQEPQRESRPEAAQAPLDLPPPPATKPFVVWSSSPTDAPAGTHRDE